MKRILAIAVLILTAAAAQAQAPTIKKEKDTLELRIGDALFSRYHFGDSVAKPYFWPVNAPGDIPVTRAWPMKEGELMETKDHVHQKSVWFCHGDVIPDGIELKQKVKGVVGVDFWSENKGAGKIVCVKVGDPLVASDGARISTSNEWRTADGEKIMDEVRVIKFRTIGEARLIELYIDLHASVCPITFGDTKEGSMGVRVNDQMTVKNGGHFVNAEGKIDEKEIWGYKSQWCDYYGKVNGKEVGIAVFDYPTNKYPAFWHARGYGLMAANPFGRDGHSGFPGQKGNKELVKLAKGEHLKLRYAIFVHTGDTKAGKVAEGYAATNEIIN